MFKIKEIASSIDVKMLNPLIYSLQVGLSACIINDSVLRFH